MELEKEKLWAIADWQDERLWSIWERAKLARKTDKFFGKTEVKSPTQEVVLKMWWAGRIAWGWHKQPRPEAKSE